MKILIGAVLCLLALNVNAALIEYHINFTQTYFHPVVGERTFDGSFFVDDSILGVGFENMNYGPYSSEMSALSNLTATLYSPNYRGAELYNFDIGLTRAFTTPTFSTILATGDYGELIDVSGALSPGDEFSSLALGGDSFEGTYTDIQQLDYLNAVVVSRGTYTIESVSPVPIPSAVWLFGSGLLGLIGVARKKHK